LQRVVVSVTVTLPTFSMNLVSTKRWHPIQPSLQLLTPRHATGVKT
jgi:hypothetical protein